MESTNEVNSFACAVQMAKALVPSKEEAKFNSAIDAGGKTPSLALEWLLDYTQSAIEQDKGKERLDLIEQAEEYVKRLCVADPIRRRYWQYRLLRIRKITPAEAITL